MGRAIEFCMAMGAEEVHDAAFRNLMLLIHGKATVKAG
jgi:hypothetical protein